jgi:hypothetical protein
MAPKDESEDPSGPQSSRTRDARTEPAEDPDREAILARRQQFIAVALAGLASGAGCTQASPEPCLSIAAPTEANDGDGDKGSTTAAGAGDKDDPKTAPRVCLKKAIDRPAEAPPTGTDAAAGTDATVDPPKEPEATPKPCLKKAPTKPRVCLKKMPPKKSDGDIEL